MDKAVELEMRLARLKGWSELVVVDVHNELDGTHMPIVHGKAPGSTTTLDAFPAYGRNDEANFNLMVEEECFPFIEYDGYEGRSFGAPRAVFVRGEKMDKPMRLEQGGDARAAVRLAVLQSVVIRLELDLERIAESGTLIM